MAWTGLLLLAALAVGLAFLLRWFLATPPGDLAQLVRAFIAAFGALASTGLIYAGRFGIAVVTLGAMAYAVRAYRRSGRAADPMHEAGAEEGGGKQSSVRTAMLEMSLDHGTGQLDGRVLEGAFAGRRLDDLALAELLSLRAECAGRDPDSVPLLESYLDRREPDWRAREAGGGSGGETGAGGDAAGAMDEARAREILGLGEGAGPDEIRAAYRRLMTRLHPDHGGSDYLAAQLNAARARLLEGADGEKDRR